MADEDEQRVEYRLSTTGKLVNATPERIEELMRLRTEREKLSRPAPARTFADVMQGEHKEAAPASPEDAKPSPPLRGRKVVHKGPPPKAPPRAGASGKKIIRG